MKLTTKTVTILFLMLTMASSTLTIPSVSAETTVSLPAGSAVPGCEETNECYIPYEINVAVGETVIWSNDDTAAHTVTSGSANDGPDGKFDSSLFMTGATFSHTFEEEGFFDYFCMVHPWMIGSIIVGESGADEDFDDMKEEETEDDGHIQEAEEKETTMMAEDKETKEIDTIMTAESSTTIEFRADYDIIGGNVVNVTPDTETNSVIIELDSSEQGMLTITLPREVMDAKFNDEDDEFFVLVDGEETDITETKTDTDRTLIIEFPAGTEEIEIIGTFVVPEFGTITAMILAVTIISTIVVSAKSRLSIMPRL
jgi:predicted secreted protein with PEFG-CTERM motif